MTEPAHAPLLTGIDVFAGGDGPVVALAHGAGGGILANFGPLIDAASDRYRFTGPSYPGVGSTPLPDAPLDLNTLADQVVAAGVAAGGDRFPIVGLSLGAAVAVTAAVRHPDRVSGLILTVPFARLDAQSRVFTTVWRALAAADDLPALSEHLLAGCSTTADLAALDLDTVAALADSIRETYPAGGAAHAELASRVDVTALLPTVAVPTLVIIGGQDRLLLPQTCQLYAQIPSARVIEYPDAGHIFTASATTQWVSDTLAFLDTL